MSAVLKPGPAAALDFYQGLLLDFVVAEGRQHYSVQYHPDLSPSGWHLGHCVFIESYWIREVLEAMPLEPDLHALYFPQLSDKPARSTMLPAFDDLIDWARRLQRENGRRLQRLLSRPVQHRLLQQGYLATFLIQHYAQHHETLCQVRAQRRLKGAAQYRAGSILAPVTTFTADTIELPAGEYVVGSNDHNTPYDNEHPTRTVTLPGCRIARRPVSNAEYLAFMAAGGYRQRDCWSAPGWAWRRQQCSEHPEYWRRDDSGNWFDASGTKPCELQADAPVTGISHYEAEAYARWRGARLPHEYEWEAAARRDALEDTGVVWEWCGNTLHPYPGFEAFPYEGYSCPYFDDRHYILRGGSCLSRNVIRRPTFRNYYEADKRHVFAGLRLAFEPDQPC